MTKFSLVALMVLGLAGTADAKAIRTTYNTNASFTGDVAVGDDLAVTDDTTLGDDLAVTGDTTMTGLLVLAKTAVGTGNTATTGVYGSTTIPVTASFETVISSGLLSLMTSTPNIQTSGIADGTVLILTSTQVVGGLIFQDEGTLTGSKLQLGANTRQVDLYNVLSLIYDATSGYWVERSFGAN